MRTAVLLENAKIAIVKFFAVGEFFCGGPREKVPALKKYFAIRKFFKQLGDPGKFSKSGKSSGDTGVGELMKTPLKLDWVNYNPKNFPHLKFFLGRTGVGDW